MNLKPTSPGPAISHEGAIPHESTRAPARGQRPETPRPDLMPAAVEQALAAAVKDPDRVTDLLDELSRGRLWLPLPDDGRPVTDGSAVSLPTVTYLGAEFVPAFTSARQLAARHGSDVPHIVVPAAQLARLLPAGVGIALNAGAEASIPISPEGVSYLAADAITLVSANGAAVRVGRPPADPVTLLTEIRTELGTIPDVREASRAWLSVPGQGEGLVISVTLHDPCSQAAHGQVISAIERAVGALPEPGFPIDVTFPGEAGADQVDEWISAHAEPFYIRC
jgi:hypothetical protein